MDLKKISKIVFLSYLFASFAFITGYLIRIIASRNLSVGDVGLAYFLIYMGQFFTILFDFGTTKAVILLWNKEKDKKAVLGTYLVFQILNLFFISFLILIFSNIIKGFFNLNSLAFLVFFIMILVYYLWQLFNIIFYLRINPILEKFLAFVRMIIIFVVFLIFLSLNVKNFYSLSISFAIGDLLVAIVALFLFFSYFGFIYKFNRRIFLELIKKGFLFLFIALSSYLMYYIDSFLLGHFLSKDFYAYYNYAYSFLSFPNFLFLTLSAYLFPISSNLSSNLTMLKNYLSKIVKLLLFIVLPSSLAFFIFSKEIIIVLFTKKFLFSASILSIFSLFLVFKIFNGYLNNVLEGLNKLKRVFLSYVFVSMFNFFGDLLVLISNLDNYLKLKLVALITSISWFLLFSFFVSSLKKALNLKLNKKFVFYFIKLFVANFILVIFLFIFKNYLIIKNLWLKFAIIAVLGGLIYLFVSFLLKTIPEELILLYLELLKPFEKIRLVESVNGKIKKFYFKK